MVLVGARGAHENKLKEYENHLMRLPLQWGKMGTFPRLGKCYVPCGAIQLLGQLILCWTG